MAVAAGARPLVAVFFAAGFLATVMQVSLLRELLVSAAGDDAALGVGFAVWLTGISAGASLWRRVPDPLSKVGAGWILGLLLLAGPVLLLAGRWMRLFLAPPAGELPGLGISFFLAMATLGPAGLLAGALFTALSGIAAYHWTAARGISRLYVVESLGSLAGGLGMTVALLTGAGPVLALNLASIGAAILVLPATSLGLLGQRLPPSLASLFLVLLTIASPRTEAFTESLRFRGIAPQIRFRASLHTPYQHLALGGDSPLHLYAGGRYAASFPDPWSAETLAHGAACMTEKPGRVLALSGAASGPLRFLLRHPVSELVLVEPDTEGLAFLLAALAEEDRRALSDPRVRIVRDDPRRLLTREKRLYDLILLFGSEPVTLLGSRLASREFFTLCASRLNAGGALVLPVRTAPIALSGHTQGLAGSLFASLKAAFGVVHATPGPDSLFLAGHDRTQVTLDPVRLATRWTSRGLTSDVFSGELFSANFPPDRVRETESLLELDSQRLPPGTDDRPVSFLHALARRQAETASPAGRLLVGLASLPPAALCSLFLLPLVFLLVTARRATGDAARFATATTGATGMTVSLLLLFSYQNTSGALYGELGLLTSLFMLGLAIGGHGGPRFLSLGLATLLAAATAAAIACLLPLMQGLSARGSWVAVGAHGAALLASGLATGTVFPVAAGRLIEQGASAREAGGRLETADHFGAALAALATAVVLVPALGMSKTAWLAAAATGLALPAAFVGNLPRGSSRAAS